MTKSIDRRECAVKRNLQTRSKKSFLIVCSSLFFLEACTTGTREGSTSSYIGGNRADRLDKNGVVARNNQFEETTEQYSALLRSDLSNSYLQSLNAINYHRMAISGASENFDLALEGYRIASVFSPDDWQPYYLKGLVEYATGNYIAASSSFLKAAVRNPTSSEVLYAYAASSYGSLEFSLALSIIKKIQEKDPEFCIVKICDAQLAIVAAAAGLNAESEKYLASYQANATQATNSIKVGNKVNLWRSINEVDARPDLIEEIPSEQEEVDDDDLDNQMVEVDVVILGSLRDLRTSSGINLLDGLILQFGDNSNDIPAASFSREASKDLDDSDNNEDVVSVIRAVTLPSIQYSLNIFNDSGNYSQVIAKPSLLALHKEKSEFFSGVEINAASTSGSGEAVEVSEEVGVLLQVKPQFLKSGKILLDVEAERTFLTDPDTSVIFDYRLDTSKTKISASAVLNFGQTLVLGGMVDQENQNTGEGVPWLSGIPFVKNFFSNRTSRFYEKSVTILLTPRRARSSSDNASFVNIRNISGADRELRVLLSLLKISEVTTNSVRKYSYREFLSRQKYIGRNDFNLGDEGKSLDAIAEKLAIDYAEG